MRILGVSALYHDSAAALVVDGRNDRGRAVIDKLNVSRSDSPAL